MKEVKYDRESAVEYAEKWALGRNPMYYDFSDLGGDCTNFVSQCVYAGSKIMNFTPVTGWYYKGTDNRTASWTGVKYLYDFLVNNNGTGPYGNVLPLSQALPGDIIQLENYEGRFYHTLLVMRADSGILVASHSFDALFRPLSSYDFYAYRLISIKGVRLP